LLALKELVTAQGFNDVLIPRRGEAFKL